MRFEQVILFRGINTSDCKRKVSGFQQRLTCSCRQKLEELLNLEHRDKGDERFFQEEDGEQLEGWERDSGGLSLVRREEVAPLGLGTHTRTNILAHLIVKAFLHFSIPPERENTSCSSSFKNTFSLPSYKVNPPLTAMASNQ